MSYFCTKFFLIFAFCFSGCAAFAQTETGKASFVSDKLHGLETASGEKYDKFAFSAAHLSLPFGTYVKVTNLWNGKSVVVRINDRGPFAPGRIIDVSMQAAIELQMVTAGVVDVRIETVKGDQIAESTSVPIVDDKATNQVQTSNTSVRGDGTYKLTVSEQNNLTGYAVQVGSFSDYLRLMKKVEELNNKGFPDIYVNTAIVKGKRYFRILVGNFEHKEQAELYLLSVKSKGFEGYLVSHQVKK